MKIDLIVRGICGLVPGVKELSENIKVRSLLGRFLEHSRVYYFKNSPIGENTYLGSPDWMPRNFFRRVEVAFPVEEENMQEEILQTMKDILSDNSMASELRPGGKYATIPRRRKTEFSVQENLVSLAQEKQRLTLTKPRSG